MKTMRFGGTPDRRGPAFHANHGGSCANDNCKDGEFDEGDLIRADGEGGWECASHKEEGE